jgi:hypothetical protein
MPKTDHEFNRLLANQFLTTKGFYDYGVARGLTDPDEFRMSIEKRKKVARQMVDSGMSRRGAAKALGVSRQTVLNDLGDNKVVRNGKKVVAPPEPMPTEQEVEESSQNDVFEHACLLLDEDMTDATRERFFAHIKGRYYNAFQ